MRCSHCVSVVLVLLLALYGVIGQGALSAAGATTLFLPALSAGPIPTAAPSPTPDPYAPMEQRIAELISATRVDHGLPPLAVHDALARAAHRHSADMATNGFFDHLGSDGSTPGRRIEEAGYTWYACGEIIAAGHATPEGVVGAWLGSERHRAAILCAQYQEMGVGYVYDAASSYGRYYTVAFAARRAQ